MEFWFVVYPNISPLPYFLSICFLPLCSITWSCILVTLYKHILRFLCFLVTFAEQLWKVALSLVMSIGLHETPQLPPTHTHTHTHTRFCEMLYQGFLLQFVNTFWFWLQLDKKSLWCYIIHRVPILFRHTCIPVGPVEIKLSLTIDIHLSLELLNKSSWNLILESFLKRTSRHFNFCCIGQF